MSTSSEQFKNKAQDLRNEAQEFGRATASAVRSGADDLCDKAADLKQDVQALGATARQAAQEHASTVRDAAGHLYDEGRERAGQLLDEGRQQAGHLYDQGRKQAVRFERTVEKQVRERPLQAVLVAAGVGFILGALCVRR